MIRTLAALLVLTILPSAAGASVSLNAAAVGSGPYYLDRAGETYVLSQDITVPGSGFVFAAENITLDLNGHVLTYGAAPAKYRYGVLIPPPYAHVNPIFSQSDATRWERCSGATVRNGSIVQGSARSDSCGAVFVYGENSITISGLDVLIYGDDTFAILLGEGSDWVVYGNTVTDSTRVVSNRHQGRAAIEFAGVGDGRAEAFGNTIHDCAQWGIRVTRRGTAQTWGRIFNNDIYPNTIVTNGYGIGAHASKLEVYGNRVVARNGRGIHLEGGDSLRVYDNAIEVIEQPWGDEYNRVSAHGIKIEGSDHAEIARNTVMSYGLIDDPMAESEGAALSISLSPGTSNWVHDNEFSARHLGGRSFEPSGYLSYATAVEFATADPTSRILIENNRFRTNDRFVSFVGWSSADGGPASGSGVTFRGNTFEWDSAAARTGRSEILLSSSTFSGLVFLDSNFGPDVDFRRFTAGWPWAYCEWGVGSELHVRTRNSQGDPIADVPVEGRDAEGALLATGTSDALGGTTLPIPVFTVGTEGGGSDQVTRIVEHYPYTVTGRFADGDVQAAVSTEVPGTLVDLVSSGGSGSTIPDVDDLNWSFKVLTTTPAGLSGDVPNQSEIRWLFSQPVLFSSVNAQAFGVTGSVSGPIAGSLALGLNGRLVVFRPAAAFAPGEEVTARLSGLIQCQVGRYLDGNGDGLADGSDQDAYQLRFLVESAGAQP